MGVSWWSHDIGGHHGGIEDKELYIRYIQFGAFSPILRFHVDKGKYYKREPWLWDIKTLDIAKDYMRLRHKLIPYLYTEAYGYHKMGMPLIQPIYYKYPKLFDDDVLKNQYYLGTQLLVAPIIKSKDVVMDRVKQFVFLPQGIWYDFRTGKKFNGGHTYTIFYKDEDYPVFAKAGAIIPLADNINNNSIEAPENLIIDIFPGRSNTYNLYEDDGITNLYKEGFYLITSFDYNYRESNYTLIIRALEGKSNVVHPKRNYKIKFRNTKKADDVLVYENNKRIEYTSYIDGNDFIIEVKDVSVLSQISINCKGKAIEIDALRLINDDINSIISDLQITTKLKESLNNILFSDLKIKKKRIEVRKLKSKGLEKKFIRLFLDLLEHVQEI
jgi:alpha-glucosidase (family GH31 glycosyl hydrolase)